MTEGKYLSTQEVADILGVHRRTVVRLCKERRIKYRQLTPRRIEIAEAWVQEYLDSQTVEPLNEKENENNE